MSTDPTARSTAGDVKFSLAISCSPVVWRSSSRASRASISVSGSVSEGKGMAASSASGCVRTRLRGRRSGRRGGRGGRPRTSVARNVARISSARPTPTTRAPIDRTLASLWARARRAVYRSLHSAARTPRTLLAASCSPWPLPPITMPTLGVAVADACGRRRRRSAGSRRLRSSRCRGRSTSWPAAGEHVDEVRLQLEAGVVGADGDACHAAESYGGLEAPAASTSRQASLRSRR